MGVWSNIPKTSEDLSRLSVDQLNFHIKHCLRGYKRPGTSQARKAFFKRLVWLEAEREKLHGIPAKTRRFNR